MAGPSEDFVVPTKYFPYGPVGFGALVDVTDVEVMMLTGYFNNPTAGIAKLTIADGASQPIVSARAIGPGQTWSMPSELTLFTGLKMSFDVTGCYGQLSGYPTVDP